MKHLKIILRLLIGVVFIASAVLKLLSIDHFELYIYSFGIFNFFLTSVLSRLLISFEFLLGIFLICKFYYQKTWWLTMLTMIGFTLFLLYTAIFRNDANCHCFGSFIEINPVESIFKNLAIIALLLLVKKENSWKFKYIFWLSGGIAIAALVASFIITPPDALYNKIYKPHSKVNQEALSKVLADSTLSEINKGDGTQIVAIFIPGCKFCKMSMQKLSNIFDQNHLDTTKLKVIVLGNDDQMKKFITETKTKKFPMYTYNQPILVFNAVYGVFPTILFMKDYKIVQIVNYRGLEESAIINHLK